MKLDAERVLVTPSGFHKGFIRPDDLIITDLHGRRLRGQHNPSSEFLMHEQCYLERPDISAVVHAHPPYVVALALAGVTLSQCVPVRDLPAPGADPDGSVFDADH